MIKKIIFYGILIFCIYLYGFNSGKNNILTVEKIVYNQSIITNTVYNGSLCYTTTEIKIARPEIIKTYITMNISEIQRKKILNMRPSNCENVGCSFGYILGKYDCMDILFLPRPKFSEKPSIGYEKPENITYLPLKHDGFGYFLELDPQKWQMIQSNMVFVQKLNFTMNKNNTVYNISSGNTTRQLWLYQLNGTGKNLYLRPV